MLKKLLLAALLSSAATIADAGPITPATQFKLFSDSTRVVTSIEVLVIGSFPAGTTVSADIFGTDKFGRLGPLLLDTGDKAIDSAVRYQLIVFPEDLKIPPSLDRGLYYLAITFTPEDGEELGYNIAAAVDTKLPEPGSLGLLGSMLLGWFLLVSPGVGGWLSRRWS